MAFKRASSRAATAGLVLLGVSGLVACTGSETDDDTGGTVTGTPDTTTDGTDTGGAENSAPVAVAGDDQSIGLDEVALLDGSGSYDDDGDDLIYSWAFASVPEGSTAVLNDPLGAGPSFVADAEGDYVIELTVSDETGESSVDSVSVSVAFDFTTLAEHAKRVVNETLNIQELVPLSSGAIESSDPNIAQVDEEGNILFVAPGLVEVTVLDVAAGALPGGSAADDGTATIKFLVMEPEITVNSWVGENDTLSSFATSAFGLNFVRTTDSGCDFLNPEACADVESDIVTADAIQDNVTTLGQPGFYGYTFGRNVATQSILSAERFEVRSGEAKIVFKDKLFVVGGWTTGDVQNPREYRADVWVSDNGGEWVEMVEEAEFPARLGHQLVVHDDKLWLMGGLTGPTDYNDVWVSEDGLRWSQVAQTSSYPERSAFQAFSLNGALYIAGGFDGDGTKLSDLWRSEDGSSWTLVDDEFPILGNDSPVVVLGQPGAQKAYLLGDAVLSSEDGLTWNEELESSPFTGLSNRTATVLNGKIWLFSYTFEFLSPTYGSKNLSRVYSSDDGVTWTEPVGGIFLGNLIARDCAPLAYKNKLFMVGGRAEILEYTNEVWSSPDGELWTEHSLGGFYGPRYSHAMTSFKGKLYSLGGISSQNFGIETPYSSDVWSSADGLNWQQVNAEAPFPKRGGHKVVNLGDERMCFLGGYGRRAFATGRNGNLVIAVLFELIGVMRDGWCTTDGETWYELVPSTDDYFDARQEFAAVYFNDRLWVIGGSFNSTYFADVWQTNPSSEWVAEPERGTYGAELAEFSRVTPFAPFGFRTGHAVAVHNGELYLSAGRNHRGEYLDDLWKTSDGLVWTLVNSDIETMDKRMYHKMVSFADKLWIIAGRASFHETIFDEDTTIYEANDIWVSEDDGETWTEVAEHASFEQRQNFQAVVHNNSLFIAGGFGGDGYVSVQGKDSILNDVWRSENGIDWRAGFSKTMTLEP